MPSQTTARKLANLTAMLCLLGLDITGCRESAPTQDAPDTKAAIEAAAHNPAPANLMRLTQAQYSNSVHDILGDDIVVPAKLEPDIRAGDFIALGAGKTTISARGAELYEQAAHDIAEQTLEKHGDTFVTCTPDALSNTTDVEECAGEFVDLLGPKLWRRPLASPERERLIAIARTSATTLGDFDQGLVFALATMLQSPNFLFRAEVGLEESGEQPRALDNWEMASKLSYVLWNTTPDEALLEAAGRGELTDDEGLAAQIDRMLEDERARHGLRAFFSDLYQLERLDGLTKAPELFEHISEEVGPSAREETLRTIEHLVFDLRGDWRDIMTTRETFINRKMASIYNMRSPAREGFAMATHPSDTPRQGLLGMTSILALYAHPVSTSPTLRGMFVRTKLLCQPIPAPPAGVDTSIPEPSGKAPTLRARIAEHLEEPTCAGCHNLMDPIGLGLEHFDGLGRFRSRDNGVEIDASGKLDGVEFSDLSSLAVAIRDHDRFGVCLTRKYYQYATGQELAEGPEPDLVVAISDHFAASDFDVLEMMRATLLSRGFRTVASPATQHSQSEEAKEEVE